MLLGSFSFFALAIESVDDHALLVVKENPSLIIDHRAIKLFQSESCVICFEKEASFTVIPCGHQCLCEACSTKACHRFGCPLCRNCVGAIYGPKELVLYQKGELKPKPRDIHAEEVSEGDEDADFCVSLVNYLCSCFLVTFPED